MRRGPYHLTAAVLGLLLLGSVDGLAGKLDAFEEGVQEGPSRRDRHRDNEWDDGVDSCLTDAVGQFFVEGFGYGLLYGGVASWGRVAPYSGELEGQFPPRDPGSPLIPYARIDVSYQDVESDVEAMDYRVEGGFGPVGVHFDHTHYRESSPDDELDLFRLYGLYRMSFGTMVEVDLGCGALAIDGDGSDTRFSFTVPVLIHPTEWIGVEIRPAWAEHVTDVDIALLLTLGPTSLKAGYRWIENPRESLNGPYAGASVHF